MSQLLDKINAYSVTQPQHIALKSRSGEVCYSELYSRMVTLSEELKKLELTNLGIWADNSADWIIIQLAAMHAEINVIPIPTFFSPAQVQHLINTAELELIIVEERLKTHYQNVDLIGYEAIRINLAERLFAFKKIVEITPYTDNLYTALVTFTSGSTGTPKGVCISASLIDRMCSSLYSLIQHLKIKRHLSLLPLSVMLENLAGVFLPLYAGETVIIDSAEITGLQGSSQPDIQQLSNYLATEQPDSLILTPELLKLLLLLKQKGVPLNHLKFVAVGGGKIPSLLLQQARALKIPVYEGYGLSECGSVVALSTPDVVKVGSVGKPLSHCDVKISDSGEILVYGPHMRGYLHQPALNTDHIATGDLGYLDDEGYLFITGRRKNVQINSFGRNFSPEWIESEINGLPSVIRSAIFGDGKPYITALIQSVPGVSEAQMEQQIQQLNQTLPDYGQIRVILFMSAETLLSHDLLTANGRIKRQDIQHYYAQQIENCYSRVAI